MNLRERIVQNLVIQMVSATFNDVLASLKAIIRDRQQIVIGGKYVFGALGFVLLAILAAFYLMPQFAVLKFMNAVMCNVPQNHTTLQIEVYKLRGELAESEADKAKYAGKLSEQVKELAKLNRQMEELNKKLHSMERDLTDKSSELMNMQQHLSNGELVTKDEMDRLTEMMRNDLQMKKLNGRHKLWLPRDQLESGKFSIASNEVVVGNFYWRFVASNEVVDNFLGVYLLVRSPKKLDDKLKVETKVMFRIKHVFSNGNECGVVCHQDIKQHIPCRFNAQNLSCPLHQFANLEHILDGKNGYISLEGNVHLEVEFDIIESTIDHY